MFCNFLQKIQKMNMATIFGMTKIFRILGSLLCRDTLWVKSFIEIARSCTVFKIQAFLCFAIFVKNSKIQNGHQFWRDKIFWKIGLTTLQIYPMDQKFRRNRSISHGFQDTGIIVFCNFCEKFDKIQNGCQFW